MYLMRVVKTYCPVRIVPKRVISTITGKLTVTLRHRIADKKTIICYVVVEAIVSRCRSIAPSYYSCTLLFSSTPVVKERPRLLRLHISVSFRSISFFPYVIVYFYQRDIFWSDKKLWKWCVYRNQFEKLSIIKNWVNKKDILIFMYIWYFATKRDFHYRWSHQNNINLRQESVKCFMFRK